MPGRCPAAAVTRRGTGRALRAAGGGAALAALTGGLPAMLYAVAGPPVPRRVPSWHQVLAALMSRDDPAVFLAAVRTVSWLAWAAFTACALAEGIAVARGRQAPRLPGIASLQGLAAVLVSTAVLGSLTAPATAAARPGAARPGAAWLAAPGQPVPAAVTLAAGHRDGPGAADGSSYRVREGDNLWDIAARRLGAVKTGTRSGT